MKSAGERKHEVTGVKSRQGGKEARRKPSVVQVEATEPYSCTAHVKLHGYPDIPKTSHAVAILPFISAKSVPSSVIRISTTHSCVPCSLHTPAMLSASDLNAFSSSLGTLCVYLDTLVVDTRWMKTNSSAWKPNVSVL